MSSRRFLELQLATNQPSRPKGQKTNKAKPLLGLGPQSHLPMLINHKTRKPSFGDFDFHGGMAFAWLPCQVYQIIPLLHASHRPVTEMTGSSERHRVASGTEAGVEIDMDL